MDKVFIENFEIETIIGIYDHERVNRQKVVLDIELYCDIKPASESGDIDKALNYKTLTDKLKLMVEESQFLLIETLAESVADFILDNHKVTCVRLKLHKPDALDGKTNVGIEIERRQASANPRPGFMA